MLCHSCYSPSGSRRLGRCPEKLRYHLCYVTCQRLVTYQKALDGLQVPVGYTRQVDPERRSIPLMDGMEKETEFSAFLHILAPASPE